MNESPLFFPTRNETPVEVSGLDDFVDLFWHEDESLNETLQIADSVAKILSTSRAQDRELYLASDFSEENETLLTAAINETLLNVTASINETLYEAANSSFDCDLQR
jgi:hypothetical protein